MSCFRPSSLSSFNLKMLYWRMLEFLSASDSVNGSTIVTLLGGYQYVPAEQQCIRLS